MLPSTDPIIRIPIERSGHSEIHVQIQPITSSLDPHLTWWDANIQPIINLMPKRADNGWRWKRIMSGLNGLLFRHQAPAGFAITFPTLRDPHGQAIVGGLTYAVRHYAYLGNHGQKASYLWYCASAPRKVLNAYLAKDFGSQSSLDPQDVSRIAVDLTIQESVLGGYHGRMGLHADPHGGPKLRNLYSEYGMTALPEGSLPPTLFRTILEGPMAKGYFYFDETGALTFSRALTFWR